MVMVRMGDDQSRIMTEMGGRDHRDRSQAGEVQDDGALTQAGQTILTLHTVRPGGARQGRGHDTAPSLLRSPTGPGDGKT